MMVLYILYILFLVVLLFVAIVCTKIKVAGMSIKDFIHFVIAVNDLDDLYVVSENEKSMSENEQRIFLEQAEKIFDVFDRIPTIVWEDEYEKYSKVLDTYRNIRMLRWGNA